MAGYDDAELFVNWRTGVPMALADTNRSTFIPSGASAAPGLVPAPPLMAGAVLFLREDGTWASPSVNVTALGSIPESTIVGRAVGAGTGNPQALSASEATAILNIFVSASAGKKGLVPAPTTSDVGKILTAEGWASANSGGLTLLTGASIASSTSVVNINLSSYTGYSEIYVQLYAIRSNASAADALMCQFSSNGTTYTSVSYEWSLGIQQGLVVVSNDGDATVMYLTGQTNFFTSSANKGYNGKLHIIGPFQASIGPRMLIDCIYANASTTAQLLQARGGAVYYTAMAVNGLALFCSVSTFAGGRYEVFGYASV